MFTPPVINIKIPANLEINPLIYLERNCSKEALFNRRFTFLILPKAIKMKINAINPVIPVAMLKTVQIATICIFLPKSRKFFLIPISVILLYKSKFLMLMISIFLSTNIVEGDH